MAEVKLKGLEIYRYNKQTLSKTRQMSLQKICFCMMKHGLLQRNRYAFRKRPDKGKETKKVFHKNSSLITTAHNTLKYSALLCDECVSDSSRLKSTNIGKALSTPQNILV